MEKIPRSVFTEEFKEEAVRMVVEAHLTQPEVCRRLSLAGSTLARWVAQARKGGLVEPKRTPVTQEEMEVARLKRKIAELKMERDILKNATAYFARESLKGTRS